MFIYPGLSQLTTKFQAESRAISPENRTGAKGEGGKSIDGLAKDAARELGQGWKVSPYIKIPPNTTETLALIDGPGIIQHIWMTITGHWRFSILRIYWDDEPNPSVETPVGDFFCMGWCEFSPLSSLMVCVNPGSGFNCYWPMPFRKRCRITLENIGLEEVVLYYQIDYCLMPVSDDTLYFHAFWHRENPVPYKEVYTILEGVRGQGQYVGTYIAWQPNQNGWWGEGEVKFYIDGDEWPTICGTGTEDYFGGSYCFVHKDEYMPYCTPYAGLHQVIKSDGLYRSQQRFGMYRWHIMDPVFFRQDLRVTIQALGWRSGGRYLPRQDDIASVAYWYQTEPHQTFSSYPLRDILEVITG